LHHKSRSSLRHQESPKKPLLARPTFKCKISGKCCRAAKDAEAREIKNQDFGALPCENRYKLQATKAFLFLTGEAGYIHGFLCAFAPLRENMAFTA
jgi:hypothetical protein